MTNELKNTIIESLDNIKKYDDKAKELLLNDALNEYEQFVISKAYVDLIYDERWKIVNIFNDYEAILKEK